MKKNIEEKIQQSVSFTGFSYLIIKSCEKFLESCQSYESIFEKSTINFSKEDLSILEENCINQLIDGYKELYISLTDFKNKLIMISSLFNKIDDSIIFNNLSTELSFNDFLTQEFDLNSKFNKYLIENINILKKGLIDAKSLYESLNEQIYDLFDDLTINNYEKAQELYKLDIVLDSLRILENDFLYWLSQLNNFIESEENS